MKRIALIGAPLLALALTAVAAPPDMPPSTSTPSPAEDSGTSAVERTTGEYAADATLTAKVRAALMKEPGLRARDIQVETFAGKVQLSGFVASQDQIAKAEVATRGVDGVKEVKNDLRLRSK